jgi:outer membrane protein assembly factor BamB
VKFETPALAVIDGSLCQLKRDGGRATGHGPLATAIVEFRRGPLRYYVREHPSGLLPGLPNLYCLDAAFRLQWMAEWPDPADPCTSIVGEAQDALVVQTGSGATVRLDALTGRLLGIERPVAVAS